MMRILLLTKIAGCNFESNDKIKKQFMGEVLFSERSGLILSYHVLFGNVPIIDAPLSPSEVKKVPQSSAREVLDNIVVPDLINAQTMLPLKRKYGECEWNFDCIAGACGQDGGRSYAGTCVYDFGGFPIL